MFTMMRLFALTTLAVNPAGYVLMKRAAEARHEVFKNVVERDDRPLRDTWHQALIDYVYPI